MALKITDSLCARLAALLLVIALAGLSSGLLVRQLIVSDFRSFISGKMEDRSYWIMARLEGKYGESDRWEPASLADDVVWAYMMGLAVRVSDIEKKPVIDLRQAVGWMSPPMKKRVLSYAKGEISADFTTAISYPLFHKGEEIGQLEVISTSPDTDLVFVARSNILLLVSLMIIGAITLLLSIFISRRIIKPVEKLTVAAQALKDGDMTVRIHQQGAREFRTMADAFNQMADSLTAQETLRKKLLTNAAHELRTPLTIMRLQVEAMADGIIPADQVRLTSLMAEMDRLRGTLGALDELSQAEASALNLQKQPILLRDFLEPIVERFAFTAPDVRFIFDVSGVITVTADPDRLSQIVINLVSNSVKAVGESGEVVLRVRQENDSIIFSIEDSGCGIMDEDFPYIFERFYHGFAQGMGVGLAVVKELVDAHGGTITASNNPDGGACFKIVFPE